MNDKWKTLDTQALLNKRTRLREQVSAGASGGVVGGTTSANVGAYPRPLGPVLRRTPSKKKK